MCGGRGVNLLTGLLLPFGPRMCKYVSGGA